MNKTLSFGLLLGALTAAQLGAQSLNVDWFTVDGGGGASSDGTLAITGTAGQPDTGAMSDGTLTVQGGFWPGFQSSQASAANFSFTVYYSTTNSQIGRVNGNGTGNTMLFTNGSRPRLSPDGATMAFIADDHGYLSLMNLSNRTVSLIPPNFFGNPTAQVGFDWSRDGSGIYCDQGDNLAFVNRTNGATTPLGYNDVYDDAPVVNPVNDTVAYHNLNYFRANTGGLWLFSGYFIGNYFRYHLDGTVYGDYWAAWSPDGNWLAFLHNNPTNHAADGYFKIKSDGTGRQNLLAAVPAAAISTNTSAAPAFTPDGQWVVAAFNLNSTNGIYAIAADGSGDVRTILTTGSTTGEPYSFIGSVVPNSDIGTPPVLTISATSPGQAVISWTPATPGFVLQENSSLAPANWSDSASGAQNPVAISTGSVTKFYRLAHP